MLKNIFRVAISNFTSIISGILTGFLIPKMLSVQDYGYYKTFTLYVSYLGICSLGIIDGIVLQYGSQNYDQLDEKKFRSYFKWYMIVHVVVAAAIIGSSFLFKDVNYSIICVLLGANLIAVNVSGYFQQISQITQRFKEYSFRKILQSLGSVVLVAFLFAFSVSGNNVSYVIYSVGIVIINFLLVFWYIHTYRKIVFGDSYSLNETRNDILGLIKIGFPLLFANLCSTLILSLDRQFVNVLFSNKDYAVYAFAYSMLSLITVATSAISTVLYPMLKRMNEEEFKRNYDIFLVCVTMFVYLMVAVYYPLSMFINWYLPKYHDSIEIFRIIIPGIAISSSITVLIHNYYKTLQKNIIYFKKSIVILVLSGIINYIAYRLFGTMQAISMASVVTIIVWYLYVDNGLSNDCESKKGKNIFYIIMMLGSFYLSSSIPNMIVGFIIYVVLYFVITFMYYKNYILQLRKMLSKRTDNVF